MEKIRKEIKNTSVEGFYSPYAVKNTKVNTKKFKQTCEKNRLKRKKKK